MPRYRVTYPGETGSGFCFKEACPWFEFDAQNDNEALEKAKRDTQTNNVQGFELYEVRCVGKYENKSWISGSKKLLSEQEWEAF